MKEYIEREAAIKEIKRFAGYLDEDMILRIKIALSRLHAADVRPVVRGEWIGDDYAFNRCSECGYEMEHPEEKTPFCPNCGADMRGDNDV